MVCRECVALLMLASASKARHRLLEQVGMSHSLMASGLDEESYKSPDALKMVEALAFAKAKAVMERLVFDTSENSPYRKVTSIVGCDSVFVFQDEVFGKPKDSKEAIERWERMSSNSGVLITGHALLFNSSQLACKSQFTFDGLIQAVISTRVEFVDLNLAEIEEYVSTGEPMKCAGGFALEGKGARFIGSIDGCYSNVIGLSLPWLRTALAFACIE
jgi:septum formation protein